jgi:hypothetical protein
VALDVTLGVLVELIVIVGDDVRVIEPVDVRLGV